MTQIVVIEPHADDAFLSLGWHIEKVWAGHDITIVTVYNDARRGKEAQLYAHAVGAVNVSMGLDSGRHLTDGGEGLYIPELARLVRNRFSKGGQLLYTPLGLQHPDHLSVALTCQDMNPEGYYLDTPYQTKQMNADDLSARTRGRVIASLVWPPKTKWRHRDVFASQSKFWYYNAVQDWKLPEVIVV